MKKIIWAWLLCLLQLWASTCAIAEPAAGEAVFCDFTLMTQRVSKSVDRLEVLFSADFATEAEAASYAFFLKDTMLSDAELEALYRELLDNQWWRPTPDTRRKMRAVFALFKTPDGEQFPPEGSFAYSEFSARDAKKQPDGTWRLDVRLEVSGFSTDEKGIWIDFYLLDTHEEAPFPSAPEQTLYVEFP